jgi:hypothetical protein
LCHYAFEVSPSIEHSLRFNRIPHSLDDLSGGVWDISCCDEDGDEQWLVGITLKLNVGILRQI